MAVEAVIWSRASHDREPQSLRVRRFHRREKHQPTSLSPLQTHHIHRDQSFKMPSFWQAAGLTYVYVPSTLRSRALASFNR